jgi:hypothetical protein
VDRNDCVAVQSWKESMMDELFACAFELAGELIIAAVFEHRASKRAGSDADTDDNEVSVSFPLWRGPETEVGSLFPAEVSDDRHAHGAEPKVR